jgi:chemotaxis signal transduction protein
MSGSKLRILAVRTRRPQLLEADSKTFGLLVDEVTGLIRLADVGVCQAPRGQARPFISGTIDDDGQLVLIADARALAGRL